MGEGGKNDMPPVYSGVYWDIRYFGTDNENKSFGEGVFVFFDIPFSFIGDTLFLPSEIHEYFSSKNEK